MPKRLKLDHEDIDSYFHYLIDLLSRWILSRKMRTDRKWEKMKFRRLRFTRGEEVVSALLCLERQRQPHMNFIKLKCSYDLYACLDV